MKVDKTMICINNKFKSPYGNLTLYKSYHIEYYDPNDDTICFNNDLGHAIWTNKNRFIELTDFRKIQIEKIKNRINATQ